MTIFDLIFIACVFATLATLMRVGYLATRGRSGQSRRVLVRLGGAVAMYMSALVVASVVAPARQIEPGEPHCFDDFCVTIDSARRGPANGAVARVILSGRLTSKAARRQRENGLYGMVIDDRGTWHTMSKAGQAELDASGRIGGLTGFVEPRGVTPFTIPFDVAAATRTVRFVARHGWFPVALIIANEESLFHRPATVELTVH